MHLEWCYKLWFIAQTAAHKSPTTQTSALNAAPKPLKEKQRKSHTPPMNSETPSTWLEWNSRKHSIWPPKKPKLHSRKSAITCNKKQHPHNPAKQHKTERLCALTAEPKTLKAQSSATTAANASYQKPHLGAHR
jgi:hypothetical protein